MKNINIPFGVSVTINVLGMAVWFWILDIVGVDVWAAHRIGYFVSMILEKVN